MYKKNSDLEEEKKRTIVDKAELLLCYRNVGGLHPHQVHILYVNFKLRVAVAVGNSDLKDVKEDAYSDAKSKIKASEYNIIPRQRILDCSDEALTEFRTDYCSYYNVGFYESNEDIVIDYEDVYGAIVGELGVGVIRTFFNNNSTLVSSYPLLSLWNVVIGLQDSAIQSSTTVEFEEYTREQSEMRQGEKPRELTEQWGLGILLEVWDQLCKEYAKGDYSNWSDSMLLNAYKFSGDEYTQYIGNNLRSSPKKLGSAGTGGWATMIGGYLGYYSERAVHLPMMFSIDNAKTVVLWEKYPATAQRYVVLVPSYRIPLWSPIRRMFEENYGFLYPLKPNIDFTDTPLIFQPFEEQSGMHDVYSDWEKRGAVGRGGGRKFKHTDTKFHELTNYWRSSSFEELSQLSYEVAQIEIVSAGVIATLTAALFLGNIVRKAIHLIKGEPLTLFSAIAEQNARLKQQIELLKANLKKGTIQKVIAENAGAIIKGQAIPNSVFVEALEWSQGGTFSEADLLSLGIDPKQRMTIKDFMGSRWGGIHT